ncbi:MAG: LysR family transcriptional regulator [Candidatus Latescibacterota bacterium]|jgi:DNA-binding transcriptional LysR family regulator
MNLQHLRYFMAVARTGGFTPAAREMNVTQPTVSSGISELERVLNTQLFNRDSRHVELTGEGRLLMNYALQIEDLLDEMGEKLERGDMGPGGGFRFGAIDAAIIYLLPEILKRYMRENPGVELSAQVAPSRYLVDDLLTNRSEFAVISLPYSHPKIATMPLCADRMPLVVGGDHRFARQSRVNLEDVVKEPLLLFHADSVSRKIVDERLAEAGLQPGRVMEMRSPEAMRKLVEAGVGISFLPERVVAESVARGDLCKVEVRGVSFTRDIGIAWRRGRYFGPAIRLLLEQIVSTYGSRRFWLEEGEAP